MTFSIMTRDDALELLADFEPWNKAPRTGEFIARVEVQS